MKTFSQSIGEHSSPERLNFVKCADCGSTFPPNLNRYGLVDWRDGLFFNYSIKRLLGRVEIISYNDP